MPNLEERKGEEQEDDWLGEWEGKKDDYGPKAYLWGLASPSKYYYLTDPNPFVSVVVGKPTQMGKLGVQNPTNI